MMDDVTWNNSSSRIMALPSFDQLQEQDCVFRSLSKKSEIMNESLQGSLWQITDDDFGHQQEEIFMPDSSGKTSSFHPFPLPLTTTSSSDIEILKNFRTSNHSTTQNPSSGISQNYSVSLSTPTNTMAETEHPHCSIPKLGVRNCRDSGNTFKKTKNFDTTSSSDIHILKNFKTLNYTTSETPPSCLSPTYSVSLCNPTMAETEHPHCRNPIKKPKPDCPEPKSISFRGDDSEEIDGEAIAHVKEIIYIAAALRPVIVGSEDSAAERPRRKNLKISSDPQTAAARHRRERISNRLRVLQRMVPGGRKMDTASMLDEAANYLKFLKAQVSAFENFGNGGFGQGKNGVAGEYDHGVLPFPVTYSF